jgi:hypothetical protein
VFVTTNSTGATTALPELVRAFLDRFAPAPATPETITPAPRPDGLTPAALRAGFYKPARHNESTVEKMVTLLGPLRMAVAADGTAHFGGHDWKRQPDGLYVRDDGLDHFVPLTGPGGTPYLSTDATTFVLMSADQTPMVNLLVLLVVAVCALSVVALPVAALWRRWRKRPRPTTTKWRAARWLVAGASVLGLAFVVGAAAVLITDSGDFLYGVTPAFAALLVLPLVALAASAAGVVFTVIGWKGSGAGVVARVHHVVLFAGIAALTWFVFQWNLIGWQY